MARPKYHFVSGMRAGDKDQFFWTPMRQGRLEQIITAAFQTWGGAVFAESQRRVPVVTGQLKASGSIMFPPDSFELTYNTPYAIDVESGRRKSTGAVSSQPWIQRVPAHIRRTKKGRIHIAAHTKTYLEGRKPVRMADGQWRVFTPAMVSKGRHFLGGALKSILKITLSTNDGLQKYLQNDTV